MRRSASPAVNSRRPRRALSVLLFSLLSVVLSVAAAPTAYAGPPLSNYPYKAVGAGVNRTQVSATWHDNRPYQGIGRPAYLDIYTDNKTDCNRSQVSSVWVRRIQAGSERVLASGRLNNWDRCQIDGSRWKMDWCCEVNDVYPASEPWAAWENDYNLWAGPGGSPSSTNKQELRVYLFDAYGHELGRVGLPYPG